MSLCFDPALRSTRPCVCLGWNGCASKVCQLVPIETLMTALLPVEMRRSGTGMLEGWIIHTSTSANEVHPLVFTQIRVLPQHKSTTAGRGRKRKEEESFPAKRSCASLRNAALSSWIFHQRSGVHQRGKEGLEGPHMVHSSTMYHVVHASH